MPVLWNLDTGESSSMHLLTFTYIVSTFNPYAR
jgi:hypothetical protein